MGFAKLEARNGQCRTQCEREADLYGWKRYRRVPFGTGGRETFLGNVFVRGGNGEFRANVDTKNVEGTGTGLDTYFGLSVHDVKNSWRCYKTIWEDTLAAKRKYRGESSSFCAEIYCGDVAGSRKETDTAGSLKSSKRDRGRDRQRGERREQEEKTAHAAELRDEAQETEEASSAQGENNGAGCMQKG
ncbi:MAG: hypothetical protein ACLUD2_21495 [Clostridium sp.]